MHLTCFRGVELYPRAVVCAGLGFVECVPVLVLLCLLAGFFSLVITLMALRVAPPGDVWRMFRDDLFFVMLVRAIAVFGAPMLGALASGLSDLWAPLWLRVYPAP